MKTKNLIQTIGAVWLLFAYFEAFNQADSSALFQRKDLLEIKIEANLKSLLKDRGEKPIDHLAKISYLNNNKGTVLIPLKIRVRGNFRRSTTNCTFPPLLLDFNKKGKSKTVFKKQNKLKLVTQCQREEYVFNEQMVYDMYNLLSDYSFKSRLVEVTYQDSMGKRKLDKDFGFLIEDETDLAKRNNAKNHYNKNLSMVHFDSFSMATVSIFQYMIGNNDWSVPALHNIKVLIKPGILFIPVPYDFDHAGIVEAYYALPPPQLEIFSVRERLYRGLNYPPEIFQRVFDKFNKYKPQFYALYQNNPHLNKGYVKRTIKYLDEFYEQINDSKAIKKYFVAGRTKN